jgi:hypothetical protein
VTPRITISATTATRSTVRIGTCSYTGGQRSETTAAAARKIAGAGTGKRPVSVRRHHRKRDRPGNQEEDGREVCNLGHGDTTPTRLPGTPRGSLRETPLRKTPRCAPHDRDCTRVVTSLDHTSKSCEDKSGGQGQQRDPEQNLDSATARPKRQARPQLRAKHDSKTERARARRTPWPCAKLPANT